LCKKRAQKRLVVVALIFLSIAIVSALVADLGSRHFRAKRERSVYTTVLGAAESFGVSPAIVLAVIRTESDFYPRALSPVGAIGLMQILPETFAYLRDEHLKENLSDEALWEPEVNVRYGTYYLSYLFERFHNWPVALAAYNAGEGRVADWLKNSALSDGTTLFIIPYPETEHYVAATLDAYRYYLEKYNFKE